MEPPEVLMSEGPPIKCRAKYAGGQKKLFSRVTENWNKIPNRVKNVKTVSGFKRSYKKHRELVAPPQREKDLEARWRDGAQHEEDSPREVRAWLLGGHHQVNKKVNQLLFCFP